MTLQAIGFTKIKPQTFFFWDLRENCVVEITDFQEVFLVRASKSYRLLKQSEKGRDKWSKNPETRSRSLGKLHDYLKDNFTHFQITVNFSNQVIPEATRVHDKAGTQLQKADQVRREKSKIVKELQKLNNSYEHGFEDFKKPLEHKINKKDQKRQNLKQEYEDLLYSLEKKKQKLGAWQEDGTLFSYLFTFSTDPAIARADELDTVVSDLVSNIEPGKGVMQKLQGPNYMLFVEELDEPRVFQRFEHTSLLNPESTKKLIKKYPGLENQLQQLQRTSLKQYQAYANTDLETRDGVFEREKNTPSHAVQDLLTRLDTHKGTTAVTNVPNDGPYIGTVSGTEQVVGFDPGEKGPHFYLAGSTGAGKSHLKRVLLENCVSMGYDVLSINPNSIQNIGISLPNPGPNHGESQGIDANQYWVDNDQLLDLPDNIHELFSGVNAVTFKGVPQSDKEDKISDILEQLYEIDHSHKPLYVFLDEAQVFDTGKPAEYIQKISQEGRKYGVNLVLTSQSPKAFSYNQREVRRNTSFILLNAKYAQDIQDLVSKDIDLSDLDRGEAVFADFIDLPEMVVEIRDIMTYLPEGEPSDEEVDRVDKRFKKQFPEIEDRNNVSTEGQQTVTENVSESELSEEQEELLEYIKKYISENDERPSKSKCWRPDIAPFGSSKTERILDELIDKGVLTQDTETRYGNEATVYQPEL